MYLLFICDDDPVFAAFLAEQETADAEDGIDSSFLVQMLGYVADVEFLKGKHVAFS